MTQKRVSTSFQVRAARQNTQQWWLDKAEKQVKHLCKQKPSIPIFSKIQTQTIQYKIKLNKKWVFQL